MEGSRVISEDECFLKQDSEEQEIFARPKETQRTKLSNACEIKRRRRIRSVRLIGWTFILPIRIEHLVTVSTKHVTKQNTRTRLRIRLSLIHI